MISSIVSLVAELLILALIVRAILSWFAGVSALQPVIRFLNQITEPLIAPIRRRLPPVSGIDFSPFVALLLIWLTESVVLFLLAGH